MRSPLSEVLLSSSSALTAIHDLRTGALLTSFKASSSSAAANTSGDQISRDSAAATSSSSASAYRKTVDVVEARDGQAGIIVAAVPGKAAITVWSFQREAPLQRLITPTKVACLACSNDGNYLAVGGHDGRLFLWEISSGSLLASFDAHYRAVTCLAWTDDSAALISAADDSAAHVWSLPVMLASPDNPLLPVKPYASLTDHTLPLTSLHVSFGSFPRVRVLTGSLDGTVKLWDLSLARSASAGTLLSTFSVGTANEQVTHVAMDSLERTVFVGCKEAKSGRSRVVRVDLYRRTRRGEDEEEDVEDDDEDDQNWRWEALGGGGRGDIVRLDDAGRPVNGADQASKASISVPGRVYALPSASDSIASMHLSPLSSTLVLGTTSGHIHILSLPSMQCTRTIVPLAGATAVPAGAQALGFVQAFMRPQDLVSRSGGGGGSTKEEIQPRVVAAQLGRTVMQSSQNTGAIVSIKLNGIAGCAEEELLDPPTWASLAPKQQSSAPGGPVAGQAAGQGLQEENARLREQLARSIALNDRMWEGLVDGVLSKNAASRAAGAGMQIDD